MGPGAYAFRVRKIRNPTADRFRFTLAVTAGAPGCASNPVARVDGVFYGKVYVTTSYDSNSSRRCSKTGTMVAETRVAVKPGQELVVDDSAWKPVPGTEGRAYALCNMLLGCHPSEDRCSPEWANELLLDLPQHRHVDSVLCSGRWLVLDVDAPVSGCASVDGSTPPAGCAASGLHRRWFATLGEDGKWAVVASQSLKLGKRDRCAEIRRQRPDFPKALCPRL